MPKTLPIKWFGVGNDMESLPKETSAVLSALEVSILKNGLSFRSFKSTLVRFMIKHKDKTLDGNGIVIWIPSIKLAEKLELVDTKELYYIFISDQDNIKLANNEPNKIIYCNISDVAKQHYKVLINPYDYTIRDFTSFAIQLGNNDVTVTKIVNTPRTKHKAVSTDPLTIVQNINNLFTEVLDLAENKSDRFDHVKGYLETEVERNLEQFTDDSATIETIVNCLSSVVETLKRIYNETPLLTSYILNTVSNYILKALTNKISLETLTENISYLNTNILRLHSHVVNNFISIEDIDGVGVPNDLISHNQKEVLADLAKYIYKTDLLGLRPLVTFIVKWYDEPFFNRDVVFIGEDENSELASHDVMLNLPKSDTPYVVNLKSRFQISLKDHSGDYSSIYIPRYYTYYSWAQLLSCEFTKMYYKIILFNAGIITLSKEEKQKVFDTLSNQVFKYNTEKIPRAVYSELQNLVNSVELPLNIKN